MAVSLTTLPSNSINNIDTNFQRVDTALQDSVSRSGTNPNQMNADFDMNGNDILNVKSVDTEILYIDGEPVAPSELGSIPNNSVGANQIIDGSVGTAELADDSVTTIKIVDSNITEPKLDDSFTTKIILTVNSHADAKAVDTTRYNTIDLKESGKEGLFDLVDYATYSSLVAVDTTEAIIIRSTQDSTKAWLRSSIPDLNIAWAGASVSESEANNLAALEAMIAIVEELGYGLVTIPVGINYGYNRNNVSTHPNHIAKSMGITVDFLTIDYGVGSSYLSPAKEGMQIRYFPYTVQTTPTAGLHDGNVFVLDGNWHPAFLINNTADLASVGDPSRTADDNRRGSIIWANDGVTTWRIGQGMNTSASLTDEELSEFGIAANGLSGLGVSVLTGIMTISKVDAKLDWYTTNQIVHFRNNAATKIAQWVTTEATDVRAIFQNSSNTAQLSVGTLTGSTDVGLAVAINSSTRLTLRRDGQVLPGSDNAQNFGAGSLRWGTIYAGTGAINTSDLLSKTNINSDIVDAVYRAVRNIDIVQYQFIDAVEKKSEDGARIHFGVIAQYVGKAFENEGLDPNRFGLFCYDKWDDEYDVEGNLINPAGERYGIRYDELHSLMFAAERDFSKKLEDRLNKLEKIVNGY